MSYRFTVATWILSMLMFLALSAPIIGSALQVGPWAPVPIGDVMVSDFPGLVAST